MSQLKVNSIVDAAGGSAAVLYGVASPPNSMGFRNRIINGEMRIDQRNAGASVTPSNGDYTIDRWRAISGAASKFSIGRNAGAVTPPSGFSNYLGLTSLSAYTVGASEIFAVRQPIEGFNVSDLGWGAAGAQAVTLSFWVRSSLTGTFGATLRNSAQDRTYPLTYTVSAANTWEFKTVNIAGDTSGTWLTNNGIGIELQFSIGAGSSVSGGTANVWNAGSFQSPSGCVSVVGTSGATFYITGVQLEAGSVASPFERRDYGRELMMCQRYFWNFTNGINYYAIMQAYGSGSVAGLYTTFPVQMRAVPTATFSGTITPLSAAGAPTTALTNGSIIWGCTQNTVQISASSGSSGLVAGNAVIVNTATSSSLQVSAEL